MLIQYFSKVQICWRKKKKQRNKIRCRIIDAYVYSNIIAMFVSVLFCDSSICGEPKNIDAFVASLRPGSEVCEDERQLGQMVREIAEL